MTTPRTAQLDSSTTQLTTEQILEIAQQVAKGFRTTDPAADYDDLVSIGTLAILEAGAVDGALARTVAKCALVDQHRRIAGRAATGPRRRVESLTDDEGGDIAEGIPGGEDDPAEAVERADLLRWAVDHPKLSPTQRSILRCMASGMDQAEAARMLMYSPGAVSRAVRDAFELLRTEDRKEKPRVDARGSVGRAPARGKMVASHESISGQ